MTLFHPETEHTPVLPHLGTGVFTSQALKRTAGMGLLSPWEESSGPGHIQPTSCGQAVFHGLHRAISNTLLGRISPIQV